MGPRLFRRGNRVLILRILSRQYPLQWGHAFSGVETSLRTSAQASWWSGFNGATPFQAWKPSGYSTVPCSRASLQWGHAFSGVETCGAEARRVVSDIASMGPRLFRRGNTSKGSASSFPRSTLQWGHAFSGVETLPPDTGRAPIEPLQWGHAFSGVETQGHQPFHGRSDPASMGPRLFRRGNEVPGWIIQPFCCALQWGHAFSGVETLFYARLSWKKPKGFNGATPFQAWKLHDSRYPRDLPGAASMGPRLFRRGNR